MTEQINPLDVLESAVLGAVIVQNSTLALLPRLECADFRNPRHRAVFSAMRNLETANQPIDLVTLQMQMAKEHDVNPTDTFALLGELALRIPTVDNALEYARQLRDASIGRRVRVALSEILEKSRDIDGAELLSMTLAAVSNIDEEQPDETATIYDLMRRRFKQLEDIAEERRLGQRTLTGYPTGVERLDERIGGWQAGIVSIVAARPGMGKSSLGLATADAVSAAGFGVHLFSLEDTVEAYSDRAISRGSTVPAEKMRNCELVRGDYDLIVRASALLRGRRWLVDGRSGMDAEEIVRAVRRHKKQNATKVAIVDYVQLVKHARRNPRPSTHEALGEIVTTFADAAKHDGIAYVVMSQLNREIEKRQDKRPVMSDLRESGSLEERAKCIVGVYRGSEYGLPVKGVDWAPSWKGHEDAPSEYEHERQVQLLVLKNSNGQTGTVFAAWDGPTTRIS